MLTLPNLSALKLQRPTVTTDARERHLGKSKSLKDLSDSEADDSEAEADPVLALERKAKRLKTEKKKRKAEADEEKSEAERLKADEEKKRKAEANGKKKPKAKADGKKKHKPAGEQGGKPVRKKHHISEESEDGEDNFEERKAKWLKERAKERAKAKAAAEAERTRKAEQVYEKTQTKRLKANDEEQREQAKNDSKYIEAIEKMARVALAPNPRVRDSAPDPNRERVLCCGREDEV